MLVCRNGAVLCDGVISDGEYTNGATYKEGKGLFFLVDESYSPLQGIAVQQENFISISHDMIYCALRLYVPCTFKTVSPAMHNESSCYCVSVSLGLTQGDHPALRGSLLTNTYYFSASDNSCIGFTGERVARSISESSVVSRPLSTFSRAYRENGLVLSDGTCWNAETYCENAAFSMQKNDLDTTVVVEVKIPLEDALLSVHPSQRDEVRNAIKTSPETLCGSFVSRVYLDATSSVITGIPSRLPVGESETLFDWMKNNFETPASGFFIPEILPIPLYLGDTVPLQNKLQNQKAPVTSTTSIPDITTSDSFVSVPPVTSQEIPLSSRDAVENDESIFDFLPDETDKIPEETQIVYAEKSADEESEENSLPSNILATVTGVLIFASVLTLCIYFHHVEKKKEEAEKRKKNGQKKKNKRNDSNKAD